jgi:hypothetical protein
LGITFLNKSDVCFLSTSRKLYFYAKNSNNYSISEETSGLMAICRAHFVGFWLLNYKYSEAVDNYKGVGRDGGRNRQTTTPEGALQAKLVALKGKCK